VVGVVAAVTIQLEKLAAVALVAAATLVTVEQKMQDTMQWPTLVVVVVVPALKVAIATKAETVEVVL
jgi:hypothetical protein